MNICYVCDADLCRPDGPSVNEREFTVALQIEAKSRGDQVSFIIPKPFDEVDIGLKNVQFYKYDRNDTVPGLCEIVCINWRLFRLLRGKIGREGTVFIIRIDSLILPAILSLYIRHRAYCVKTLGDIYLFHGKSTSIGHRFKRSLIRGCLKLVLKRALFIDVCTPQLLANYQKVYGLKNIHLIDNAVNTERFYPMDKDMCKRRCGLEGFKKLAGYCGGYPSQRGARELIEVSQDLVKRYPDCGIVIVGDDPELKSLKKRARELGTDGQVVFRGVVDYEKVSLFVNCLDVGVGLDTAEKVTFVGNASQKIRQYIACGVPFVCPAGTNEQLVEKGFGVGIPTGDLDAFLESICYWLDMESAEKKRFVKKANQHVRDHYSVRMLCCKRYSCWKAAIKASSKKDNYRIVGYRT